MFAFGHLTAFEQGAQVVHALLYVVRQYLVQSKMGWLIKLFEEIGHEVFQKSVLAVELQERRLVGSCGFGDFEIALVIDTGYYGKFPYFFLVLHFRAVFQYQHIVVIAV